MTTVTDAVLARLRAAVDPVHDASVPSDTDGQPLDERYAVVYAAAGRREALDLAVVADTATFRWQVTSVGVTREQAQWVAERCRDALLDGPGLAADGWNLGRVRHVGDEPVRRDDDLPRTPLFYAVDTYELTASRQETP